MQPPFPSPGELLPHRPPMLLLRAVISHDAEKTCCEGWFDNDFSVSCGGEVSTTFGLELIAQTAAVHHGLRRLSSGQTHATATRGLLLGSRRMALHRRTLPVGESLRVTVFDHGQGPATGGMIRFEGTVENAAGALLAAGDATVLELHAETQFA